MLDAEDAEEGQRSTAKKGGVGWRGAAAALSDTKRKTLRVFKNPVA